jgi:sodium pump decarboxylase gamma subunit
MSPDGSLSVGTSLLEGLQVTVVGMCIVFGVLIILMLVLMAMKKMFYKEEPAKAAVVQENTAVAKAPKQPAKAQPEDGMDEEELVAILTAAIAASMNTSTYNLKIKSYRRIGNQAPAWNQAGLRDTIDSRF